MENINAAREAIVGPAENQGREMKDRFDDYAAIAVRIFERIVRDAATVTPPLTVGDPSIRMEGERSKKQKSENSG